MPLPIDIHDLFTGRVVEWERLEFKEGWNPEAALRTICAFANDFHNWGGGYLVFGVEEKDGRPVLPPKGLEAAQVDAIQKKLLELGHSGIQPAYHPLAVPTTVEGRLILVVWAPGGQGRPYKARTSLGKDAKEWAWFIRHGSSTVQARGADEQELLSLAAKVPFDDRTMTSAKITDLSRELIVQFLDEVESDLAGPAADMPMEKLARQMNLADGAGETLAPRNAGLLFFHPEPWRFFPQTQIDVVWFPDDTGGDRFEEKSFRGPLARMLREALDYIRRNYLKEIVIKHPDRAESDRVENFPYAAVEEAVVNAIYHRSYEEREPVEVRITPQELIVLSFPGPDRSISLDDLRQGRAVSRRYRNRRVGEFLKELDLTEGRATGIPKILRAMQRNGSPPALIESDEGRLSFMIRLPVHPEAKHLLLEMAAEAAGQVTPEVEPTTQVTVQVAVQVAIQVSVLEKARIPVRARELQEAAGMKNRVHFHKTCLFPLMEQDLLERTIPDKPNSRLQKYRLTDKGRAWLAKYRPT